MSAPAEKQTPKKFGDALKIHTTSNTRIEAIATQLGDEQGDLFMKALHDPTVRVMKIQAALKDVGIKVSHSTLGTYRVEHGIKK